ncbi:MAG TPA: hypothetical protein VGN40_11395 [Lelliottia sp.]
MNTSANAGSQLTATEVKFHTYPFNCTSLLVSVLSRRSNPASLYLLTTSTLTLRAVTCIAARLCCRATVNLSQNRNLKYCASPVRHFNREERESDARNPRHCTSQLNCASA